jgi:predicted alpha/beta superfamily hydrolase
MSSDSSNSSHRRHSAAGPPLAAVSLFFLNGLGCAQTLTKDEVAPIPLGVTGVVRFHGSFPSRYVAPRHVEVWLPPAYQEQHAGRYPVIYMHDGQNVFSPATSFVRIDWGVDETMTRLIAAKRVRPALIVAIWNSAERTSEYLPQKALSRITDVPSGVGGSVIKGPIKSDAYLRFIVEEVKPFIDSTYRTRPDRANTFLMGSSMGGLISVYGMIEYPDVFGGAASLSTHWPAAGGATVDYVVRALPKPDGHRFYFDHGTATLDSLYAPYQKRVDEAMRAAGYSSGINWSSRVFPHADHSERAWRERVSIPLEFLLGPRSHGP